MQKIRGDRRSESLPRSPPCLHNEWLNWDERSLSSEDENDDTAEDEGVEMKAPFLPISSFCKTGSGTTPSRTKSERYFGGDIPWVKSGELRESIINNTEETVTEQALAETPLKVAPKGSILVAMYGANVGRVGILGIDATTNQAVCHIVPERDKADSKYMFYALQQKLPEFISRGVGGAQPNISQQIIRETKIPLPPIAEQKRIAAILDKAEELRGLRRKALGELDAIVQSIFLEMFGDSVRNSKGWLLQKLSEISMFENGDRSKKYPSGSDIKDQGVLFLNSRNIVHDRLNLSTSQFISEEKFRSLTRGKAKRGDLLITLRGTLGSCCIFDSQYETAFVNAQMMIIRSKQCIMPVFLHAFLTSPSFKRLIASIGQGAAVLQLTATQLAEIPVSIPPLDLQQEFARRVEAIEHLKTTHRESLTQLNALFASLQHRAFRGEL